MRLLPVFLIVPFPIISDMVKAEYRKFGFDWIISLLFNERNETLWKGWFCTVISFLVKKVLKLLKSRLLDRWDIKSYN